MFDLDRSSRDLNLLNLLNLLRPQPHNHVTHA
jgi:hypothetical protein